MAESYRQLQNMTIDQLIEEHDKVTKSWNPDPSHYLAVISRKGQEEQTKVMLRYTKWITLMTLVMTVTTIIILFKN